MIEWSEREIEALREHYAQGLSYTEIAKLLWGRNRNMVAGKVARLGLPKRSNKWRPPSRPRPGAAAMKRVA